ncbi:hypothetical protein THRCLA_20424 [Thraustotheca clavata]|uniref:Uncharacterized protein n=1 Tax=Thraustotheca clavata TaxID=74557 RepID=A0A1W0A7B3_9STRA|nr:hypothetical protein THRCLA_20424 [Thraustotheca clavata]
MDSTWIIGAAVGSSAGFLLAVCLLCRCCSSKGKSRYEAINKDLEMEEKDFALGRTSSDEEHSVVTIEDFNDEEMRQLEMLDAYRQKVEEKVSSPASSQHPKARKPSIAED